VNEMGDLLQNQEKILLLFDSSMNIFNYVLKMKQIKSRQHTNK